LSQLPVLRVKGPLLCLLLLARALATLAGPQLNVGYVKGAAEGFEAILPGMGTQPCKCAATVTLRGKIEGTARAVIRVPGLGGIRW
jgi:hypothetical protein